MQAVNLRLKYLKRKNLKPLLCACASKRRIHHIVMDLM